eukprot:1181207-Prorocentrum_minimum.AAC.2
MAVEDLSRILPIWSWRERRGAWKSASGESERSLRRLSEPNQNDRIGNIRERPPIRTAALGISVNNHQSE